MPTSHALEINVIRMPTANPQPKVRRPPPAFSRYERIPKNTMSAESTIVVYPRISAFSKPILSAQGTVTSIIAVDTAPEINPTISTVFFIELQSPFL